MVNSKVVNPKLYGRPTKSHPTAHWGQLGASRKMARRAGPEPRDPPHHPGGFKANMESLLLRESSAGKGDLGPDSLGGPWAGKDGCKWMCVCVCVLFSCGKQKSFQTSVAQSEWIGFSCLVHVYWPQKVDLLFLGPLGK